MGMLSLHLAPSIAFVPQLAPNAAARRAHVRMEELPPIAPGESATTKPLPPFTTMVVGDGTLAGDFGFDPLLIADSPKKLAWFREAEIRHARLAMLAAVGWPLSELFDGPLAKSLGVQSALLADGRAPSLLNGGLGAINGAYWAAVVGAAIFIEAKSL